MLVSHDKIWMRFHVTNKFQKYNKLHPIDLEICETVGAEVFAFLHLCDLESKSTSLTLVWNNKVL